MTQHHQTKTTPRIILVSGWPATGKSTLATYIAEQLGLPFLHRDGIKETLFDTLGGADRAWSQKLGGASWDLLFYLMAVQLQARASFVVESNFQPSLHSARVEALRKDHLFDVVQIWCKAEPDVCYDRFHTRATTSERHPGHVDDRASRAEFLATQLGRDDGPLTRGGKVIKVDTTDFDAVDYDEILREIR